jgi:hypothetical protein
MTRKDRIELANALADCLDQHSNIEHRHGVLAAKDAIADMLYEDNPAAWSQFESAWREKMKIDA